MAQSIFASLCRQPFTAVELLTTPLAAQIEPARDSATDQRAQDGRSTSDERDRGGADT